MSERVVVVGGSAAGARAAHAVAEAGHHVIVVSADPSAPTYRPALSKQLLSGTWTPERMAQKMPDPSRVTWHGGVSAVGVDSTHGHLHLDDGAQLAYDRLVLATGMRPRALPGVEVSGRICTVSTPDDVLRLRSHLSGGARVVVVGAGLIGSEAASTLHQAGATVTLVDPAKSPLERALGEIGNARCISWHESSGIDLRLAQGIIGVEERSDGVAVEFTNGRSVDADAVVISIGVVPATEWLKDGGIPLADDGTILCDSDLMVRGVDHVAAAGDAVSWWDGACLRHVEHWLTAVEQGAVAGENVVAGPGQRRPFTGLPMFWTEQHGHLIHLIGRHPVGAAWEITHATEHGLVAECREAGKVHGYLLVDSAAELGRYRQALLSQHAPLA